MNKNLYSRKNCMIKLTSEIWDVHRIFTFDLMFHWFWYQCRIRIALSLEFDVFFIQWHCDVGDPVMLVSLCWKALVVVFLVCMRQLSVCWCAMYLLSSLVYGVWSLGQCSVTFPVAWVPLIGEPQLWASTALVWRCYPVLFAVAFA